MASHTPDYYLSKYGSDQVPLTLGALQLEPADRAVLKIAGNLNELKLIYHLSSFDIDPREKKRKIARAQGKARAIYLASANMHTKFVHKYSSCIDGSA